jgi:hypothetical protein
MGNLGLDRLRVRLDALGKRPESFEQSDLSNG